MKNLFKPLFVLAIAAVSFTSCMDSKNDNTDYEAQLRKEEQRVDSILTAQKSAIVAYATAEFENPKEDSLSITFSYLNKTAKRGIWYDDSQATPTDDTYEYTYATTGYLNYPTVKVKYKVSTLTGTVVDSDDEGSSYSLGTNANTNIINSAWLYSFFPYSIKNNGENKILGGLTAKGLKKGSKLSIVTPSYWAFDTQTVGKVPGNQPLVYEFEVLDIQ